MCTYVYIYTIRGAAAAALSARQKRCCSLTFPSFRFSGRGAPNCKLDFGCSATQGLTCALWRPFFSNFLVVEFTVERVEGLIMSLFMTFPSFRLALLHSFSGGVRVNCKLDFGCSATQGYLRCGNALA